jgi:hypothetical protein
MIKEVEPTFEEWAFAIDFLTRTGQICDDKRQEFILLSDTLGVSMLVDAINHRRNSAATESTVLGRFTSPARRICRWAIRLRGMAKASRSTCPAGC